MIERWLEKEETRLYEIALKINIQYKGDELPDDECVIKPILSRIKKQVKDNKHAYILTQLDVGVSEIEMEYEEEDED